jgi:hypothetical protein
LPQAALCPREGIARRGFKKPYRRPARAGGRFAGAVCRAAPVAPSCWAGRGSGTHPAQRRAVLPARCGPCGVGRAGGGSWRTRSPWTYANRLSAWRRWSKSSSRRTAIGRRIGLQPPTEDVGEEWVLGSHRLLPLCPALSRRRDSSEPRHPQKLLINPPLEKGGRATRGGILVA